jgi:hypothetical protein
MTKQCWLATGEVFMKSLSLRFLVSSALVVLLILDFSHAGRTTPPSNIPSSVQRCVEPGSRNVEVVGTASEPNRTFYYLRNYLYGLDDPIESWYSLVQVDSGQQCQRLRGGNSGLAPLNHFMSTQSARQLELQRYQREIEQAGGRAAYEQEFNQRLNPPPNSAYEGIDIYLSEEQVWALRQLGIHFPDTYHLLTKSLNSENKL